MEYLFSFYSIWRKEAKTVGTLALDCNWLPSDLPLQGRKHFVQLFCITYNVFYVLVYDLWEEGEEGEAP